MFVKNKASCLPKNKKKFDKKASWTLGYCIQHKNQDFFETFRIVALIYRDNKSKIFFDLGVNKYLHKFSEKIKPPS